ncbi:MAG: hypothetical protein VYB72_00415, partial [Planctomycetota bacterium]|nr:hypothetical protein [Planctomycetota bacterium]
MNNSQRGDGELEDRDDIEGKLDESSPLKDNSHREINASADHSDSNSEDLDRTILEDGIDQTIHSDPQSTAESSRDQGNPPELTVKDALDVTCDSISDQEISRTLDGTLLDSQDIGKTVNPRGLSELEATAWSEATLGGVPSKSQTVQSAGGSPQTLVDYEDGRLRHRKVTPLEEQKADSDDYRLVQKIGQGGMGDVFVARQGSLDRLLALKLIKPLDEERRSELQRSGKLDE